MAGAPNPVSAGLRASSTALLIDLPFLSTAHCLCKTERPSLNTGVMPEKTSGVWGLAPNSGAGEAKKMQNFGSAYCLNSRPSLPPRFTPQVPSNLQRNNRRRVPRPAISETMSSVRNQSCPTTQPSGIAKREKSFANHRGSVLSSVEDEIPKQPYARRPGNKKSHPR